MGHGRSWDPTVFLKPNIVIKPLIPIYKKRSRTSFSIKYKSTYLSETTNLTVGMKMLEDVMDEWCQYLQVLINILPALIGKTFKFLEFHRKLYTFVP